MKNGILNDKEIKELVEKENMIKPFVDHQVEEDTISYGLGSTGYDIRIGNKFDIFTNINNNEIDPKNFDKNSLVRKEVENYILIPPQSYVLGHAVEKLNMPNNIMGKVVGKSTYARAGVDVTITPVEVAWRGYLTLEISNDSDLPARVYANEGIAQVIFFRCNKPNITYNEKIGKYQDQGKDIQPAKVV